jgi:hypothetical protein
MKKLFCLTAILSFTLTFSYAQKQIKWLHGTWTGIGYQPAALTQQVWPINLSYGKEKESFSIVYSSFPCNGNWEFVKGDKNRAEFIERIKNGTDKCANNLKVIVTVIDQTHVSVSYFYAGSPDVDAFSVLTKRE